MWHADRETAAALSALGSYVSTVLPRVRRELGLWRREAAAIPDLDRRRQALAAIDEKSANVEAVAVFATLAPKARRRTAVRAIVALQVAIDYLDILEESGTPGSTEPGDAGYLANLQTAWRERFDSLPSAGPTRPSLERAVKRCEAGQQFTHAAEHGDEEGLRRWSRGLPAPRGYRWWELAAGASSSVAAHALIATAATPDANLQQAESVDAAYNPAIGALTVLLDDLVDRERDRASSSYNYTAHYASAAEAAERIAEIGRSSREGVASLAHRHRHGAIVAGVAGYYLGDPAACDDFSNAVAASLKAELGPSVRLLAAAVAVGRRIGGLANTGA